MMIKFVDWLNKHLAEVDKKDYNFECTYIWVSLFKNTFVLAGMLLAFALFVGLAYCVIGANLRLSSPELFESYRSLIPFVKADISVFEVIAVDILVSIVVALFVGLAYGEEIDGFFNRLLTKFCKRIPKEDKNDKSLLDQI